jgi:polyhydroxybutyrate depolymerase
MHKSSAGNILDRVALRPLIPGFYFERDLRFCLPDGHSYIPEPLPSEPNCSSPHHPEECREQLSIRHEHLRFVVKVLQSRAVATLLLGASFSILALFVSGLFLPMAVRAQDQRQYVNVNGTLRTFVVHLPLGYDSKNKYPVVILLHGAGETDQDIARRSRFDFMADRYGIIAFYPNSDGVRWNIGVAVAPPERPARRRGGAGGSARSGGSGGNDLELPTTFPSPGGEAEQGRSGQSNKSDNKSQTGDVAFFDQMLDKLAAAYSVDASRIFATGYSDGGFMDFRLACSMGKRIAAIAPVAAAMPKEMSARCELSRAVPLLMLNGTSDPVVHYGGGSVRDAAFTTLSVQATAEKWAASDGCAPKSTRTTLPPHDKHGMTTRVDTYSGCRDGAEVAVYAIEGGGNTWPSGDELLSEKEVGKTTTDLDADEVMWKFFSAHPMPSSSSTGN